MDLKLEADIDLWIVVGLSEGKIEDQLKELIALLTKFANIDGCTQGCIKQHLFIYTVESIT